MKRKIIVNNKEFTMPSVFNFKWSLPHLNLPHISVDGGKAPFGIGGKGSLPSFSIEWYKSGGIVTNPTVFGIDESNLVSGDTKAAEAIKAWFSKVQEKNSSLG